MRIFCLVYLVTYKLTGYIVRMERDRPKLTWKKVVSKDLQVLNINATWYLIELNGEKMTHIANPKNFGIKA